MSYQNNNNRLDPKAEGLTAITPIAQNVNQQLQIKPDLAEASRFMNTAKALASLGRGIVDVDRMLEREAQANAIDQIILDKTEGNNKHDWRIAAERIKGLNRFNPYMHDSYNSLASQEMASKLLYDIKSNPNLAKLSSEEFNQLMIDKQKEMMDYCKANNISVRQGGNSLLAFNKGIEQLKGEYTVKNAEYKYNLAVAKNDENALTEGRNIGYNVSKDKQTEAYTNLINTYIQNYQDLGVPKDEILSKHVPAFVKNLVTQLASDENNNLDIASLINAVKSIDIEGLNINTLNPNFEYDVRQTLKTASLQNNLAKEQEYRAEELQRKQNLRLAQDEFWTGILDNPNMKPSEANELLKQVVTKYNAGSSAASMLGNYYSLYQTVTRLNDVTEPDTLKQLQLLSSSSATGDELEDYIYSNLENISEKDYRYFAQRAKDKILREQRNEAAIERKSQQEQKVQLTADNKQFKDLLAVHTKHLKNKDYMKNLKTIGYDTTYRDELSKIEEQVRAGYITSGEGFKRLERLQNYINTKGERYQQAKQAQNISAPKGFYPQLLLSAKYRAGMFSSTSEYNEKTAVEAVTKLGLFRDGGEIKISSGYSEARKDPVAVKEGKSAKVKSHRAYDISKTGGTPVYMPKGTTGRVVSSGYEKSMGNYSLVQVDSTGDYMLLMHLNYRPSTGTRCNSNTIIGRVGSTGHSTGNHLHIAFYQANGRNVLLAKDFLKRISDTKGKKK